MAILFVSFRQYVFCALLVSALFASQAMASLELMNEWELGGVEARTGVSFHLEHVAVSRTAALNRFYPEYDGEPENYVELNNMDSTTTYDGDLSIVVGPYRTPPSDSSGADPVARYFIRDTAKTRKCNGDYILNLNHLFEHKRKEYEILNPAGSHLPVVSDAEARGGGVVTLAVGNGGDVFRTQDSSMGLAFSVDESRIPGSGSMTPGPLAVDSGTLAVTGMKTFGQQVTIYPHGDIPGYVSGEGVALEIRTRTSIDEIRLTAPDDTVNALFRGMHLRESFDQAIHLESNYGKWGSMDMDYFTSDGADQYFRSTFDPDGYYGGAGGDTYNPAHEMLPLPMVSAPYSGGAGYYRMYDGYFLNGNINQIDFDDFIGGHKLSYDHGQMTENDTITTGSLLDPDPDDYFANPDALDDDYQIHDQAAANALAIEERPITLQVKAGRTYKCYDSGAGELVDYYDDRSYVAINWPAHGSLRVEEVQGYLSDSNEWPYRDFGPSMGSMIVDGLRVKKMYVEIPGRKEQYLITEQNIDTSDPDNWVRHNYVYDAGKLPDAMNPNGLPPWGQPDWDPIGRGQLDFLSKLGNPDNPPGGQWDLYDIKKTVVGVTYDFWHLYEPAWPGSNARWTPDH